MAFLKIVFSLLAIVVLNLYGASFKVYAQEENNLFKGYITNKVYPPLKLKILKIDTDSFYHTERNLEDNSFLPQINMKVNAESNEDYFVTLSGTNVFIPKNTKFTGSISEISSPKNFNRHGFYKIIFDEVICPNGDIVYLQSGVNSHSQNYKYNPLRHIGKTTLSLVGGSLAGGLLSYQLGGLGLAIATHGYSLAIGAAAGGFIGAASGATGKGKVATIEPGNEVSILPINEEELKKISCKATQVLKDDKNTRDEENSIKLELISIKEKKDILGESSVKLNVRFTNNTNDLFRVSNFYLRDSQGREYTTSFINLKNDIFEELPPKETKMLRLEFFVDHPKASHWLVLKDKNLTKDIGVWKVKS